MNPRFIRPSVVAAFIFNAAALIPLSQRADRSLTVCTLILVDLLAGCLLIGYLHGRPAAGSIRPVMGAAAAFLAIAAVVNVFSLAVLYLFMLSPVLIGITYCAYMTTLNRKKRRPR